MLHRMSPAAAPQCTDVQQPAPLPERSPSSPVTPASPHGHAACLQAPLPGLVVAESPLVLKVSEDPCLLLVDCFLSPQECADVRQLGGQYLKRSKVSAGARWVCGQAGGRTGKCATCWWAGTYPQLIA